MALVFDVLQLDGAGSLGFSMERTGGQRTLLTLYLCARFRVRAQEWRRLMESLALRIGEVASQAHVNIQTLRFYERRGLLAEPSRRASGYRQYSAEVVSRVRFIKRAQDLGFSLAEIQQLLLLRDDPRIPCGQVRRTAEAKMAEIQQKLRRLRAMQRALGLLVASCLANQEHHCPLLEALDESATDVRKPGRSRLIARSP